MKNMLNTIVGYVNVTEPQKRDDRAFECAAWWESSISTTGVFPVYLRESYLKKGEYFLAAAIPATVVEDFFPSLYGGNLIGEPYDRFKNAGNPARDIDIRHNIVRGLVDAPRSGPGKDGCKWVMFREHTGAVEEYFRARLAKAQDYYAYVLANPNAKEDWHFGTIEYAARKISEAAKSIEEVLKYRDRVYYSNDYYLINNSFLPTEEGVAG